jgi:hypothetical protein
VFLRDWKELKGRWCRLLRSEMPWRRLRLDQYVCVRESDGESEMDGRHALLPLRFEVEFLGRRLHQYRRVVAQNSRQYLDHRAPPLTQTSNAAVRLCAHSP